jgi:hypothetical protein
MRMSRVLPSWLAVSALVVCALAPGAWAITAGVPAPYATIGAALAAGDTVLVAAGTYTGPGNTGLVVPTDRVILSESGPGVTIIDCLGSGRVFSLSGNSDATLIRGFTLRNGSSGDAGGAVLCDHASPRFQDCVFLENASSAGGGAVHVNVGIVTFRDCTFLKNEAVVGGALEAVASTVVVDNCRLSGNLAGLQGGGIGTTSSSLTVTGTVVDGNAAYRGGGLYLDGASSFLTACTVAGNNAILEGGGIFLAGTASLSLERSILWDNCSSSGAAAWVDAAGRITFNCSDVDLSQVGGPGTLGDATRILSIDPHFCRPAACTCSPSCDSEYTLSSASGLLGTSECGTIGALGQGCQDTPVVITTWSLLKTREW